MSSENITLLAVGVALAALNAALSSGFAVAVARFFRRFVAKSGDDDRPPTATPQPANGATPAGAPPQVEGTPFAGSEAVAAKEPGELPDALLEGRFLPSSADSFGLAEPVSGVSPTTTVRI